ncbi:hypothetical protein [Peptococcus simiae]|uniref:hypothetical protein n=1 Tax=Peptococcus simiae TaxID=1643805 RepID=UPI00397EEDA7
MMATTSELPKRRTVEFYSISVNLNPQITLYEQSFPALGNPMHVIIDNIISKAKGKTDYSVRLGASETDNNIFVELYDLQSSTSQKELFGIIGRSNYVTSGVLQRLKENETEIDSSDLIIEKFTYFYMNGHNDTATVLSNSQAPNFKSNFCDFLEQMTPSDLQPVVNVSVYPMLDEEFNENINRIKEVLSVNLEFVDTSAIGMDLVDFRDAFSLSQDGKVTIKVSLSAQVKSSIKLTEKLIKLLKGSSSPAELESNFTKFQLVTENDEGEQLIIDGIKKYLRKKISIHLEDEYLRNQNNIKAIKEALVSAMRS